MRSYYALFKSNMQLTMRVRSVLFFNYLFPLIFFFAFAEMFHAGTGQGINSRDRPGGLSYLGCGTTRR
jgi:hypothetical protein